jgi:hypothetical protein
LPQNKTQKTRFSPIFCVFRLQKPTRNPPLILAFPPRKQADVFFGIKG